MTSVKVHFEIGHEASPKTKKTPEGFTHDWECFVRGQEGADISHFVEKVIFHLHDTFRKPRRVVKEPPFSIKESGYAGFLFPIEIYLKNKDEPKKITFQYDLSLQESGSLKDRYIFPNPNEEFKRKLLKGGGILVNNSFYANHDQESKSRDSFTEEKQQLVSKPKLSSDNVKKHKVKEVKDEPSYKTNCFEKLFGPPLQKPPKISPEPKKTEKSVNPVKSEKKDKERSSSDKKSKHEYKETKAEKTKVKEEKDKQKPKDVKSITKEQEKPKERANKRHSDRPISPDLPKKKCLSPTRKPPSPAPRSSNSSSIKETTKHTGESFDQKKIKSEDKSTEIKTEKESKERKKKDKKSHDRDKDRKDKKEHKKDSHKSKESPKEPKETSKPREPIKEKESAKDSPIKEKQSKPEKIVNKFSMENLSITPPNNEDNTNKYKDKGETEKKHKHKKKDKKRDESKDKHKESSKDRKHKHEKIREIPNDKSEVLEQREIIIPKERTIPDPISPISIDTASQCSSKSGLTKPIYIGPEEINSSHSETESLIIADDEDIKIKLENHSPELLKRGLSPDPDPELEPDVELVSVPEPEVETPQIPAKEKSKKHKDKSKREEKRRKRKIAEEGETESRKVAKAADSGPCNNDDTEYGESSGSISIETKLQDNGVSSSLGEDAEPGDLSPDYMVQLRGLQQRIMTIKNNEDLERVVNLIAETGRYEVTTQTFDFDLCLLDRSTVQQLIQLVGC